MGKTLRPIIMVWLKPNTAAPSLSGKDAYVATGSPQSGGDRKERETARSLVIKVFSPESEILYRKTIENQLGATFDYSTVYQIWCPFRKSQAPKRKYPGTYQGNAKGGHPGWVFHHFATLGELSAFVNVLLPEEPLPAGFPDLRFGVPIKPSETVVLHDLAAKLGIQARTLTNEIRGRSKLLSLYKEALDCPAPPLARLLLRQGVTVAEQAPGARFSPASQEAIARLAARAGVRPDYLVRVLHGRGKTLPDGSFRPYAIPRKLRQEA
jgi:hypothetical protein